MQEQIKTLTNSCNSDTKFVKKKFFWIYIIIISFWNTTTVSYNINEKKNIY